MIPDTLEILEQPPFRSSEIPATRTYRVDTVNKQISGFIDGEDAIYQFIDKALSTDRYSHEIYSWTYGTDLYTLVGKPYEYVVSEIPRIIRDALKVDSRVVDVTDFMFERTALDSVEVTFTVQTIYRQLTFTGVVFI